jgi:hypothetical protein
MKKERLFIVAVVLVSLASTLGGVYFTLRTANNASERREKEWREAARPIFEARNIPNLADHATPHDLERALDATSAMTHYESAKLSHDWGKVGTKILIVPASQEWTRVK